MTEKESILSKIRKLQNLTTERGATPEEAASAAAKAQALLFEHNLSSADVATADDKPDPYGKVEHAHTGSRTHVSWQRTLLHVIARANFCETVYSPGTTKQSVIGKKSNVEIVLYLNDCLVRQIQVLAEQASRHLLSGRAAYQVSFARGAVATIYKRLSEQRAESERTATTMSGAYSSGRASANALVIRNSAVALHETVKKFFPRTTTTGRRTRISSTDGYHAGREAGSGIGMHRGVAGRSAGQLT